MSQALCQVLGMKRGRRVIFLKELSLPKEKKKKANIYTE